MRPSFLLALAFAVIAAAPCLAQQQGQGGILVDAKGVIRRAKRGKFVSRKKLQASAAKSLSADINKPSEMRVVSLTRLEKEIETLLEEKKPIPDEMMFLAGLQRVDFLFFLEESKEIVITGPAAGFARDGQGVMVGVDTGRPVLRLDDLLQAMWTKEKSIGCSFDPVQARMADVQRYLQSVGDAGSIGEAKKRYKKMVEILGLQDVRVFGVDPTSHFAKTLVEADYALKRLSVGLEKPRVKGFQSYLDVKGAGRNTMKRWWFAPKYDGLERNEDGTAWAFTGQRVQLLAQEELVNDAGQRRDADYKRETTQQFARQLNATYPKLAEKLPILAQLQNTFDITVVGTLIRQFADQVKWNQFTKLKSAKLDRFEVPKQVPSASNSKTRGKYIVVGVVGGGVKIEPLDVVERSTTATRGWKEPPKTTTSWWKDATDP